jgi:hypothetical protein
MNEKTSEKTNEPTLGAIKKHQLGLKFLTGAALALWVVSMVASVYLVWAYFHMYRPKEQQILQNFKLEYQAAGTNMVSVSTGETEKQRVGKHQLTFVMTRVVGVGMVSTAACVAFLSAAMFATILLVIWNRRVTLRQINVNLVNISGQLAELQLRENKR